jgi:hypothetical protein
MKRHCWLRLRRHRWYWRVLGLTEYQACSVCGWPATYTMRLVKTHD